MKRHEFVNSLAVTVLGHNIIDRVPEHPESRGASTVKEPRDILEPVLKKLGLVLEGVQRVHALHEVGILKLQILARRIDAQIRVVELPARHLVRVLLHQYHPLYQKLLRVKVFLFGVLPQHFLIFCVVIA